MKLKSDPDYCVASGKRMFHAYQRAKTFRSVLSGTEPCVSMRVVSEVSFDPGHEREISSKKNRLIMRGTNGWEGLRATKRLQGEK